MTPLLFAYWLNGYFEAGTAAGLNPETLTASQRRQFYDCVQAHINLVKQTPNSTSANNQLVSFMGWIEFAIEFDAQPDKIKAKLNEIFEHVIDPMTPDETGSMSEAHSNHGGWSSDFVARC